VVSEPFQEASESAPSCAIAIAAAKPMQMPIRRLT